jgi:hypothetical protein
MKRLQTAPTALFLAACLPACTTNGTETPTYSSELGIARAIIAACPVGAPNDAQARTDCANKLTDLTELRDHLADPLLWGGQPKDMKLEEVPDIASLTEFNPRVWRRMYLSTFMFEGEPTAEVAGPYVVVHIPIQFRNMMDAGEYPYPFWHSEKKWKSYEFSTNLLLFFKDGMIVAAARSEVQDTTRSHVDHMWDGNWTWSDGAEPHVSLYRSLFSPMNPHIERLEAAYRDFANVLRPQTCMNCHSPNNAGMAVHLELLNYPNQALSGRHNLVGVLEQNVMPPGAGVADEVIRLDLIRRATDFAKIGDDALAFEGETVPALK